MANDDALERHEPGGSEAPAVRSAPQSKPAPTADTIFTLSGTGLVISGWIVTIAAVVLAASMLVGTAGKEQPFPIEGVILSAILAGLGLFVVLIGQLQRMTAVLADRHREPSPPTP